MEVAEQDGPAKGWTWAESTPAAAAPQARAAMVDPRSIPRDQRPDPFVVHGLSPEGEAWVNSPLAHPTGNDTIDGMTSPSNLAMLAIMGAKPAAHVALKAVSSLLGSVAPDVAADIVGLLSPRAAHALKIAQKLSKIASPTAAATPAPATAQAPAATASPAAPTVPAVPVSPVASGPVVPSPPVAAPVPPVEPVAPASAPLPSAASAPSPVAPSPANALPDQKALNEAALAVRRQAYQERLQASAAAPVDAAPTAAPAAGNVKLSGAETKAFLDLMKRGLSGPDAMKNVLMQRELVATLGTPTPTAAQTRFPKGQRGGPPR